MSNTFRIRYPKSNPKVANDSHGDQKSGFLDNIHSVNAEEIKVQNDYLQRLIKLIPAEVLGIYLTIRNATANDSGQINIPNDYLWLPIFGLILVLFVRIIGTNIIIKEEIEGKIKTKWDIEWPLVLISSISFIIWVYAMGDGPTIEGKPDKVMITAAVCIWTFVVPYFYKESES